MNSVEFAQKLPSRSLLTSLTAHITIVLLLTVKAVFFPSENIIISSAMKVDIVALPDKIKPIEELAPPPTPTPEPPKVKESKPEKKEKSFNIDKAKKEQEKALDNLRKELHREEEAKKEALESLKKPEPKIFKGNILAPGTEITGLAKIEYDQYFDKIRSSIKGHLILPKWLKDANLKAHVLIKLDNRGYVIYKNIERSSGNDMYDKLVIDAVTGASPLPAPPERLSSIIMIDGIILRFPDQ